MEFTNHYINSPDPNVAVNTNVTSYVPSFAPNPSNIPTFAPLATNYPRPLSYQQSDPRYKPSAAVTTLLTDNHYQKSDDELWLETYLSKIGKINLSLHSNVEIITKKPLPSSSAEKKTLKIHVAKTLLYKCLKLLKELENIEHYLRENVGTISSSEWKQKTIEIGQQKDQFTALLSQFDDSNILEQLKRSLTRRKRKRLSQKRKKVARREELAEIHKNRQFLHKNIDKWLENMKEEVEKSEREEYLKKDADCILSEVTKKKSDARKQMSLLSALVKLRTVRENVAVQRGEKVSLEDSKAFQRNAEKLFSMWENALKTYCVEEQDLRVMLEENAANDIHTTVSKERKIVSEWETILFGPKVVPCDAYWGLTCAEKDLSTFIAIRYKNTNKLFTYIEKWPNIRDIIWGKSEHVLFVHYLRISPDLFLNIQRRNVGFSSIFEALLIQHSGTCCISELELCRKSWDTFLVPNDNMNASRIPIGWVLPDQNCSPHWARYLHNTNA